jgi:twinfilin-like protein
LELSETTLRPLPPVFNPEAPRFTFQQALNRLEAVLSAKHALYIILRRNDSLVAVTYVPYLASAGSKKALLERRNELVEHLGQKNFSESIICKEMGEITDARSWDERDGHGQSWNDANAREEQNCENHEETDVETAGAKDLGYKKNKCRLCDRRLKNKINDDALEALSKLNEDGACVQLVSLANPP